MATASVANPGKYYHGADAAKMEFLLICQQELLHEARKGFVSASAFVQFLCEYCNESPLAGPNCMKHKYFSALPVEIQLAFVDRLCPLDQAEKLECLNHLNEEEEEALVSESELFGVCDQAFNQLVPTGLLVATESDQSEPDTAYPDDHDEDVEPSRSDESSNTEYGSKSKRKKEKSKRPMKTFEPTVSLSPSGSMMPSSPPSVRPLRHPSQSNIPSVTPGPTAIPREAPTNPDPQQPSSPPIPTYPPGRFPTSPLPPTQPNARTLSPLPTQLPTRTGRPVPIIPIPPDQSIKSQSSLGAAGVVGITAAALFLPFFLALALMRYRSNRARYAVVRDINLGESHSILSEDSDFLDGCYAMSPPSRRSAGSEFNPPIEEISSRHLHSIDMHMAPATYLGSGQMPPPLDIRPMPLGSAETPNIPPFENRQASLGLDPFGVSGGIQPDADHHPTLLDTGEPPLPEVTSHDTLSQLPTPGPGGLSFDSSTMDPFTDALGEEISPIEPAGPLMSSSNTPSAATWQGYMGPVRRVSIGHKTPDQAGER
jgi:hypothetical protein